MNEALAEISYQQAIDLVKEQRATDGRTIEQFLSDKSNVPAVEDLGWKAYPIQDGFEIERLMLLNQTLPLSYKWHVNKLTSEIKPENGKAIGITK